jgi:hypothetical protein
VMGLGAAPGVANQGHRGRRMTKWITVAAPLQTLCNHRRYNPWSVVGRR